MTAGKPIRVVIVDDIKTIRDNLEKLLSFETDIEVVGTAADGREGVVQATKLVPDVVLMDINMPILDGISATEQLTRELPTARVICMSVQFSPDYLDAAWRAGAFEYLVEPFSGDALVQSIRFVSGMARNEELAAFRLAGRSYDESVIALSRPDFMPLNMQAWLTLLSLRYTAAWAGQAHIDAAALERGLGLASGQVADIAQDVDRKAQAAVRIASEAWEIARGVANNAAEISARHGQCVAAAQAHKAAKSAEREAAAVKAKVSAAEFEKMKARIGDLASKKVLVVEGHPASLRLVQLMLEKSGFDVKSAGNAEECFAELGNRWPDLILMDISSSIDGFAVMRKTRSEHAFTNAGRTPIVALTAMNLPGDRERILAAGFDGYMAKPVDLHNLVDEVKRYLRNSTGTPPPTADPRDWQPELSTAPKVATFAPLSGSQPTPRVKTPEPVGQQATNPIRVLIVDDFPSWLDNLQKLLSFEPDIDVVGTAENGSEAIEQAKRLGPDIVLMDINMPIMDGIQATEVLSREVPDSRVIAMAVQGHLDYLQRALQNGARDALVKPFTGDELSESIRRVLTRPGALTRQSENLGGQTDGTIREAARPNHSRSTQVGPKSGIKSTLAEEVAQISVPIAATADSTERLASSFVAKAPRVVAMNILKATGFALLSLAATIFSFLYAGKILYLLVYSCCPDPTNTPTTFPYIIPSGLMIGAAWLALWSFIKAWMMTRVESYIVAISVGMVGIIAGILVGITFMWWWPIAFVVTWIAASIIMGVLRARASRRRSRKVAAS